MQKREWDNFLVVVGLVVLGLFMIVFLTNVKAEETSAWLAQWDFYVNHHHIPPSPELIVNHSEGRPGSYFTFTGRDYPFTYQGLVTVNTHPVGIIQVDGSGRFTFELSTTAGTPLHLVLSDANEEGLYIVGVKSDYAHAYARFVLSNDALLRPSSNSEVSFVVSPEISAYKYFTYLPLITR